MVEKVIVEVNIYFHSDDFDGSYDGVLMTNTQ